ncbi:MAG TPA: DUF5985 family protein [Gemmatimonadales bacterium]|nr:DUF5985 family protein [Gemmatimonadales bacterium]
MNRSAAMVQFLQFASGAIVMGYVVAGLFFLRFWRDTRDRLFAVFALAFWLFALQRLLLSLVDVQAENEAVFYLLRLLGFLLIIWAVVDKNRVRNRAAAGAGQPHGPSREIA